MISLNSYLIQPLLALGKALFKSGIPFKRGKDVSKALVIMGNGPSLRHFLDSRDWSRADFDLMAVNFAANTPEFRTHRPELYIFADPHFFNGVISDEKVRKLWKSLAAVDWEMTLFLPLTQRGRSRALRKKLPGNVSINWFNLTPLDGEGALMNAVLDSGLAMPRPRNVLIGAICCALRAGYRTLFLAGADHTWHQSLWVDDKNRVVSIQPHFYADDPKEEQRVASEYAGYHLHHILDSLRIAFRAYHQIAGYAAKRGIRIFNATPGSFIDAFPRCAFAQMKPLSEK